jgi:mannosyltransferase OCH1-like enzyme
VACAATAVVVFAVSLALLLYAMKSTTSRAERAVNPAALSSSTILPAACPTPTVLRRSDTNAPSPQRGLATIPSILWVTGPYQSVDSLPPTLAAALRTWTSSPHAPRGLQVRWFSHEDRERFIGTVFPQYLEDYRCLVPGAYQADLWRLLVLLAHGGVYVDCGCALRDPTLWASIRDLQLLLADDNHATAPGSIYQGVIAASQGHPLIAAMVTRVVANIRARVYGQHAVDITGPVAIGPAVLDVASAADVATMAPGRRYGRLTMARWIPGQYNLATLGRVRMLRYNNQFVYDEHNNIVVQCKPADYYNIMYTRRRVANYRELWAKRRVYQ